ncbi:phage tail protein [Aurantimonas aggregata]|uniref:Phage tail protein n=1 Tax=Aurantimonas aggregata TaxID=2047720 RepID=A0A6L9MLN1_9HYPH|nr:tail protein X [Aurantimonas aggregata]NDV88814.1 phage tail protein [Aurantimonas aggregata]
MARPILVRGESILLDQLLTAEFGPVRARETMIAALDLNPGLAEHGAVIPVGTTVLIPDPPSAAPSARRVVSLFG